MEERKRAIISILVKTSISFAVSFFVMMQIEPDWGWNSWVSMALIFSTVPHGWGMITRIFGSWIVFDGALFVCGILLKLLLSLILGWILVPACLFWNIGMLLLENRKESIEAEYIEVE